MSYIIMCDRIPLNMQSMPHKSPKYAPKYTVKNFQIYNVPTYYNFIFYCIKNHIYKICQTI